MKLLLDESLPVRLRQEFPESITVESVGILGWKGAKNGQLLSLAVNSGFNALLTADRNIEFQQNLQTLPCAVIVLLAHPSALQTLAPLVPKVVELCAGGLENHVYRVSA